MKYTKQQQQKDSQMQPRSSDESRRRKKKKKKQRYYTCKMSFDQKGKGSRRQRERQETPDAQGNNINDIPISNCRWLQLKAWIVAE